MGICKSSEARVDPSHSRPLNVIIIGLDNAGKTTLKTVFDGKVGASVVPTVGLSKPLTFEKMDYFVSVYDVGGQQGFRGAWTDFFTAVHGVICVVDSADVARLEEAKGMLNDASNNEFVKGKPILVLANKQDLPAALPEVDISMKLGLENLTYSRNHICKCIAKTSEFENKIDPRIEVAFKWLLDSITTNYDELNKRVNIDVEAQKIRLDKEKEERAKRVEILLAERKAAQESGAEVKKVAPKEVPKDGGGPLCTLCKTNPAELKHSVSKWKPVCQKCVDSELAKLAAAATTEVKAGVEDPNSPKKLPSV